MEGLDGFLVGIDVDVAEGAEAAEVVDASHVVVVDVGEEHAIEFPEGPVHELHADVGSAVDEDACGFGLEQACAAVAEVARVGASAHFALAAQHWHAC